MRRRSSITVVRTANSSRPWSDPSACRGFRTDPGRDPRPPRVAYALSSRPDSILGERSGPASPPIPPPSTPAPGVRHRRCRVRRQPPRRSAHARRLGGPRHRRPVDRQRRPTCPRRVRLERLDIATDPIGPVVGAWRPDVVFHLAAQASVPVSIRDPLRDLAVNVVGTHRVAAAARAAGAGRLVFVSSGGAIYGETPDLRRSARAGPDLLLRRPQARRRGPRRAGRAAVRDRPAVEHLRPAPDGRPRRRGRRHLRRSGAGRPGR